MHNSVEIEIHSSIACVVTLRGEHDVNSREAVTLALAAARDYANILVDLAGCTFIDSSIITTLLEASKRARQCNGTLELVVPCEANAVRRTLEIANVQGIMPFNQTPEDGLASMAAGLLRAPEQVRPGLLSARVEDVAGAPRSGTTILRAQISVEPAAHAAGVEHGTSERAAHGDEGQLAA